MIKKIDRAIHCQMSSLLRYLVLAHTLDCGLKDLREGDRETLSGGHLLFERLGREGGLVERGLTSLVQS